MPRQFVLGGALVATLAATAWVASRPEDEAVAGPASPAVLASRPAAVTAAPAASAPPAAAPERPPWAEIDAAQLAAWQPPPPPPPPPAPPAPPPVVAAPPPSPVAPPAPYQMIGRLIEVQGQGEGAQAVDVAEVALLSGPNKMLSVKRGDVIDGQWRVELVSTSGVRLTWLPASLPQNIVFKAAP